MQTHLRHPLQERQHRRAQRRGAHAIIPVVYELQVHHLVREAREYGLERHELVHVVPEVRPLHLLAQFVFCRAGVRVRVRVRVKVRVGRVGLGCAVE